MFQREAELPNGAELLDERDRSSWAGNVAIHCQKDKAEQANALRTDELCS